MRMMLAGFAVLFAALLQSNAASAQTPKMPPEWQEPAQDMLSYFETSGQGWGAVTNDFDCQGVSVGVLQWNVGRKSFQAQILAHIDRTVVLSKMPTYGQEFLAAYDLGGTKLLDYVRTFQTYKDDTSCDSSKRKAKWTEKGRAFRSELKALLESDAAVLLQRSAMDEQVANGWKAAIWWATSKYGAGVAPSFTEFAFFLDTVNFNGPDWWRKDASFAEVCKLRVGANSDTLFKTVLDYLGSELPNQVQEKEAGKNVALWTARTPGADELDLVLVSYLISKNIGSAHAVQFKKNVISRRGTIIFNDGWVNGERKSFLLPPESPRTVAGKCPA
jgi:hypothetical protein